MSGETWKTYLEVGKGNTMLRVMSLAQEQVPEPELFGLALQFLDDGDDDLPPLLRVSGYLRVGNPLGGQNLLLLCGLQHRVPFNRADSAPLQT